MSVLDRKLRRELLASKGVLAAIIAIITVGICCFVGMASLYFNLEDSRRSYYAQTRMADFSVQLKKLPLNELERIRSIPGVMELQPRILFEVTADIEGVLKPIAGQVVSLPDEPAPVINNILIRRGGYFTNERQEEVIINDAFARAHKLKPGDSLHVLLNNRRQKLTIVGTAISAEYVYIIGPGSFVPDPQTYGVFYLKHGFAEEAFDYEGACNQVVGLLNPDVRERPDAILDEIELRLDDYGVASTTPRRDQPSHLFLMSEIEGLKVNATVLPAIFLGVAALILNVLMTRIAEQQRTIVGTLKALGYSNRQLFGHFVKFGLAIGLFGGMLGTLGGYAMAGALTKVYVQYYELPRLVNQPYWWILSGGMLISVVFSVAGTLRGIRLILKLNPAEAMRPKPPAKGHSVLLERVKPFWSRLDFRWQIVIRGIFRQRMRTLAGLFAAAMGSSLLLVTFHMSDAVCEMIEFQFDKVLLSDYDISFKEERNIGAYYEAQKLPGVDFAEPQFQVGCTFRNGQYEKQGGITGLLPDARLTIPREANGTRIRIPKAGLVLTRRLAEQLKVEVGQAVTIEPVDGRKAVFKMPVMRIVDSYMGNAAYADLHALNHLVGETDTITMLQLKVQPGRENERAFYEQIKHLPVVQSVTPVRGNKETMERLIAEQMGVAIGVITLFAGLIFFGSVLNASLISLAERQQEIATFRVLGYTSREVGAIFLRESLCINLMGSFLGLGIGYWLSYEIGRLWNTDLFRLPFIIHAESWCWPIIAGVVFTLLAHIPVHRSISHMNVPQSLNVKE